MTESLFTQSPMQHRFHFLSFLSTQWSSVSIILSLGACAFIGTLSDGLHGGPFMINSAFELDKSSAKEVTRVHHNRRRAVSIDSFGLSRSSSSSSTWLRVRHCPIETMATTAKTTKKTDCWPRWCPIELSHLYFITVIKWALWQNHTCCSS